MKRHLFMVMTKQQKEILVTCYDANHDGIGLDYLAYTQQFDDLVKDFEKRSKTSWSRHNVWCNLIAVRKKGRKVKVAD